MTAPQNLASRRLLITAQPICVTDDGCVQDEKMLSYVDHQHLWGTRASRLGRPGHDLWHETAQVGLTGRGGGHFSMAKKWSPAVAAGPGGTVVINAAEGEPGSAKDSVVCQTQPHLVLNGALNAAEIIGATEIVLWIDERADRATELMSYAINERRRENALTRSIRIMRAPSGYASGESSAVIAGVRGDAVAPTYVADRAQPWGDGRPVLVHNVESLARLGALGHTGPAEYPNTSLVTVSMSPSPGIIGQRRVLEVAEGDSLADVLLRAGADSSTWVLLGGYAGTWLDSEDSAALPIEPHQLKAHNLSMGAGIVMVVPRTRSLIDEAAAITALMAAESAGQCGPCVFGLPALANALTRNGFAEALDLTDVILGRGGCGLPDGVVRMVESALALHSKSLSRRVDCLI